VRVSERVVDVGSRTIAAELTAPDGAGPWPGVLLLHETFGLTTHVRADARSLARAGFLVLAPDLFTGGIGRYCMKMLFTPAALANTAELGPTREVARCLDYLKELPECNGRLGMIGMCLTGGFVLQMARRDDLAAPVVFHHSLGVRGGGMPSEDAADVRHTILGHFAELDTVLCPRRRVDALKRDLGDRLDARFHAGVGHGLRSTFRHTAQSAEAWAQTLQFFRAHLV
jgi:carboxymethylenebutenolidase